MRVHVTQLSAIMNGGDTDRILCDQGSPLYIPIANINCLLAYSMHKFWKECCGRAWGEGRGRGREEGINIFQTFPQFNKTTAIYLFSHKLQDSWELRFVLKYRLAFDYSSVNTAALINHQNQS